MKQKFEQFIKSSWGLELWLGDKRIFRSKKSGVRGLLDFINERGEKHEGIIIFDKIVGQAVALLAAYLRAKEVYGATAVKLRGKPWKNIILSFIFKIPFPVF